MVSLFCPPHYPQEIGFYFGFLGHLSSGLLPLVPIAVIAQVLSFVELASSKTMTANMAYSVIATAAFVILLAHWRFKQSSLIHLWGCSNKGQEGLARPGYHGIVMKDPTTGKLIIDFPNETKASRARATLAVSSTMIAILLGTTISIFFYKAALAKQNASSGELLIPAFLNAVQVGVYGVIYQYIATVLTEFEVLHSYS